jgi:hypothetical protein
VVEEAGVGRTLIKALKAAGLPAAGVIPQGDKLARVSVQLEKFANRQVFFPREAPWLVDFEKELFAFPDGPYDDQVDALIQALADKRPSILWNDAAALKGWDNLTLGADGVERLLGRFENAVNFPFIPCFAARHSLFQGKQGIAP